MQQSTPTVDEASLCIGAVTRTSRPHLHNRLQLSPLFFPSLSSLLLWSHCNNSCGQNKPLQQQQQCVGMAETHLCDVNMPPLTTRKGEINISLGIIRVAANNDIPATLTVTHRARAHTSSHTQTGRLSLGCCLIFFFSPCCSFKDLNKFTCWENTNYLLSDKGCDLMGKRGGRGEGGDWNCDGLFPCVNLMHKVN